MCNFDLTDPAVFARTYREHRDLAFTAANAVLRDAGAAEDVVQDVFLRIWSRPRSFDPSRGSLATYIAVIPTSAGDRYRVSTGRRRKGTARLSRLLPAYAADERRSGDRSIVPIPPAPVASNWIDYEDPRVAGYYLAIEADRPHRREALAALFWPDHTEEGAHLNLRQSILRLRRALPLCEPGHGSGDEVQRE